MLSDSDSSDSDNGIRFKTTSTRNKEELYSSSSRTNGCRDRARTDNLHSSGSRHDRERRRSHERRGPRSESMERRRNRSNSQDRGNKKMSRERSSHDRGTKEKLEKRSHRDRRSRDRSHDRLTKDPLDTEHAAVQKSIRHRSTVHEKREKISRDDQLSHCRSELTSRQRTRIRNSSRQRSTRDRSNLTRDSSTRYSHNDDDRQDHRLSERRPSGSRERIRECSKNKTELRRIEYDIVRVSGDNIKSGSVDKIDKSVIGQDDNDLLDRHKTKKVKHKKHKRSKREDNGTESKSTEREMLSSPRNKNLTPECSRSSFKIKSSRSIPETKPTEKKHRERSDRHHDNNTSNINSSDFICGPSLPPHLKHSRSNSSERKEKFIAERSVDSSIPLGPALPPSQSSTHKLKEKSKSSHHERKNIGPSAPSQMLLDQHAMSDISDSDDDYLIGPVPVGTSKSEAHLELEKRALELKLAKYAEEDQERGTVREEWMIALPEVKPVANLGVRQFRTKERPDLSDRSSWTDTPKDRDRKLQPRVPSTDEIKRDKKREAELVFKAKRDAEQEEATRKHSKKHHRDESLLEIHQKKMKKKREKELERPSRRPFDRDTDLKVNRFDQTQANSVLKKGQLLSSRFGSGESKYL